MRYLALLLIAAQGWGQTDEQLAPCTVHRDSNHRITDVLCPADPSLYPKDRPLGNGSHNEFASGWVIDPAPPQPTEFPDGPFPCVEGFKLQRYSAGNMHMQAQLEDFGGWKDVDAGPHEGDYRCVKDKPSNSVGLIANPIPGENMEYGAATTPSCTSEACPQ